jgi:hypothetical protein
VESGCLLWLRCRLLPLCPLTLQAVWEAGALRQALAEELDPAAGGAVGRVQVGCRGLHVSIGSGRRQDSSKMGPRLLQVTTCAWT